jgi:hypothetical protein
MVGGVRISVFFFFISSSVVSSDYELLNLTLAVPHHSKSWLGNIEKTMAPVLRESFVLSIYSTVLNFRIYRFFSIKIQSVAQLL